MPNDDFERKLQKQGLTGVTSLYLEVGKGLISPKTVVAKLQGKKSIEKLLQRQMKRQPNKLRLKVIQEFMLKD